MKMKLIYWGTWGNKHTFIHTDCSVSHSDFVQKLGYDKDSILIGCNAYVHSDDRVCEFCDTKFTGEFPKFKLNKVI